MSHPPYGTPAYPSQAGSLESGIRGEYELNLREIILEAWEHQNGNKTKIWIALFTTAALSIVSFFILTQALGLDLEEASQTTDVMVSLVLQLGMTALVVPLATGLIMMVIKITAGVEATPNEVFNYFDHTPKLIVWVILQSLMTNIGLILLILPGVYLAVAYQLSLPVMIEKNLRPWRALESSRKAITTHWLQFFLISICLGMICFFACLTVIGAVFALPWYLCTVGVIYRKIFGFGEQEITPQSGPQPYKPIVPPTLKEPTDWSRASNPIAGPTLEHGAQDEPYRNTLPPDIKKEPEDGSDPKNEP